MQYSTIMSHATDAFIHRNESMNINIMQYSTIMSHAIDAYNYVDTNESMNIHFIRSTRVSNVKYTLSEASSVTSHNQPTNLH